MNRIMKKTTAAVLSVAMLASSAAALNQSGVQNGLAITASAANDLPPGTVWWGEIGGVYYWEYPTYVTAVGCTDDAVNITIQENIHNKPVTGIDFSSNFANKPALKTVTINAKIQHLSANIFENDTNLTSVYLPNTLQTIGQSAFAGCSKLEKFDIPYATNSVGYGALAGCTKLKKIIAHGNTSFNSNVFKNFYTGAVTSFTGKFYCYTGTRPATFALNKGYNRVFYKMGDVNFNNIIDATDASQILGFYASLSTGGNLPAAQREKMEICADVTRDGRINAIDASAVLSYYAAISTGYTYSFEYFMANR